MTTLTVKNYAGLLGALAGAVVWLLVWMTPFVAHADPKLGYDLDANTFLSANLPGHLTGDAAPGKLIPWYRIGETLRTNITLENVFGKRGPNTTGLDLEVHVTVFNSQGAGVLDFNLCLSPFDLGSMTLQKAAWSAEQINECLPRFAKCRVLSIENDLIPPVGFVTLRAITAYTSTDGTCVGPLEGPLPGTSFEIHNGVIPSPTIGPDYGDVFSFLATWATLEFPRKGVTEAIPTPTALIDPVSGMVSGGAGAFGLTPANNTVVVPFDADPRIEAAKVFVVWQASPGPQSLPAFIDCQDEIEFPTTLELPDVVNEINPSALPGMQYCRQLNQPLGVIRFQMPKDGIAWVSQQLFLDGSDDDGIPEILDKCSNTPRGVAVDHEGCSWQQFCAAIDATTAIGAKNCQKSDWQNDEPLMTFKDADCVVKKGGHGRGDDRCVARPE